MSFLTPFLLWGLFLGLLPIIIHLINQHRHRTVKWGAMMFLLSAKKMTKGMARVRQILILAMRVLAILALVFAISRPLASGWVALTAGGKPDTVLVILDRSASMEQQNLLTQESKRSTALGKIAELIGTVSQRTRVVLVENAENRPIEIDSADDLLDLPATEGTDTSSDIPAMLETALDHITANATGRTDIWVASDLRAHDWGPGDGRWETIRTGFNELEGVRFYLLNYPQLTSDNISVVASNIVRRKAGDQAALTMDVYLRRTAVPGTELTPQEISLEFVINGVRTQEKFTIESEELALQGHTIPIGTATERGWGRIEIPADSNPRDNSYYFVFDEAPAQKTVIVSDDRQVAEPMRAAATASVDSSRNYEALILEESRIAEIPWNETGLLLWHAPIPSADSPEGKLMVQYVQSGKSVIFFPTDDNSENAIFGSKWGPWQPESNAAVPVGWWRTDSDLLSNTQNGAALPVGELQLYRLRDFEGEGQPLAKIESGESIITRATVDGVGGSVYFCGTLPTTSHSSLARDGIVFFVMLHRALADGSKSLANAQQRDAGMDILESAIAWKELDESEKSDIPLDRNLIAGAFGTSDKLVALNRSLDEDALKTIDSGELSNLFSGLDYREIEDEVGKESSLASEIWRAFLITMALALIAEALLCFPPKTLRPVSEGGKTTA